MSLIQKHNLNSNNVMCKCLLRIWCHQSQFILKFSVTKFTPTLIPDIILFKVRILFLIVVGDGSNTIYGGGDCLLFFYAILTA